MAKDITFCHPEGYFMLGVPNIILLIYLLFSCLHIIVEL